MWKDSDVDMTDTAYIVSRILENKIAIAENNGQNALLVSLDGLKEILALLEEQEAVTIKKTKEHGFGVYGGICPKCRNWIQSAYSFCGFCGQAVKFK